MQTPQSDNELAAYEMKLISVKAWQLSRRKGFTPQDRQDIEQEMTLDLIRRLPQFDPAKAKRTTFASQVVKRRCSTLLRDQYRQIRDPRKTGPSLDEPFLIIEDEVVTRLDHVTQDDLDALHGNHTTSQSEVTVLRLDVSTVMDELPPMLRQGADLLSRMNIREAAQAMGMSRSTFYEKVVHPLRDAFAVLAPYVTSHPTRIGSAG